MSVETFSSQAGYGDDLYSPTSPGADYGLQTGFDPFKYDFYNPVKRVGQVDGPSHPAEYVRRLDIDQCSHADHTFPLGNEPPVLPPITILILLQARPTYPLSRRRRTSWSQL